VTTWFSPVDLKATVVGDPEMIDEVLASVEASVTREPRNAEIVIEGTEARIEPAEVGLAVQRDIVTQDLLEGFGCSERSIQVAAEFVPVAVTEDDAQQALTDALKMMSGPVTVTYEDKSWEFGPEVIGEWIDFRAVPVEETSGTVVSLDCDHGLECTDTVCVDASGTVRPHRMMLEAFISANEASQTVYDTVGEAGSPAQNATFKASGGRVQIVPHKDGTGPDVEALATSMTNTLLGDGERVVALRTTRVEPEITTEVAEGMGIKERIATFTTTYSSGNAPRVNNIHVLADMLDGTLIPPGGTFSFNGTIGPRTADKGFQAASAIVNGELVPQLGGGICQVATTLFNTIYESGLPVLERKNHSLYISSYPKGRDAAVSWSSPDLKFQNDTDTWILIATGYSNSSVTMSLYGTDPGYDVTSEVGSWTNIRAHPVQEVKDDTLPEGSRVTEESGADGRTITVKRIVKKDGELVREDSFRSVYRSKTETVRVGTKKASTSASATVSP
jgi:vancomycin resistance protein YoaR